MPSNISLNACSVSTNIAEISVGGSGFDVGAVDGERAGAGVSLNVGSGVGGKMGLRVDGTIVGSGVGGGIGLRVGGPVIGSGVGGGIGLRVVGDVIGCGVGGGIGPGVGAGVGI